MARWNKTLRENSIDILTNVIQNVHPLMSVQIMADIDQANLENKKKIIENYIRRKMNLLDNHGSRTISYWTRRGWDKSTAYVNTQKNKSVRVSPFSIEFWTSKVNPSTNVFYTLSEAEFERNSRRPTKKEYWVKRGIDERAATTLAAETKNKNNKAGAVAAKNSSIRSATNKRCVQYYTSRGYTDEESACLQKDFQKLFSKDICIEKYGPEKGVEVWSRRQQKWKESLKKSGIYQSASKSSLTLFDSLSTHVAGLQYGQNEAIIHCRNAVFSVDCLYKDKIIEFYGDYWHANPKKYNHKSKIKSKIAEEIWANDLARKKLIEEQGFKILEIWESESSTNLTETINKCLNFLNQ